MRISDWSSDVCSSDLQYDEGAKPLSAGKLWIIEAVDHRQPVGLLIGKACADQSAGHAVDRRFAIFDHPSGDRRLFDHVGIVEGIHAVHPSCGMAGGEIALHQRELLFRAPWPAGGDLKIGIALQQPLLRRIRLKGIGDYADRKSTRLNSSH